MSSNNNDNNKNEHWSDDWPVQRDDPLAEDLHLEQPFLATGPSLAACSGSDIHLAKSATASNKQRCLAILPGVLSLKPPAANKEDSTTTTTTAATTTEAAPEKPDEDNNDNINSNTNNNSKSKSSSERTILGSLTGLGTSTTPTLTLGGGGDDNGDSSSSSSSPKLQLQGKLVPSTSKFVVLTLQPKKKRVICKHIFDSVVVFGEPQAVVAPKQEQQEAYDQDVKLPPQEETFFHYGCSVRTIDGGSASATTSSKNGETTVVEDPYLNPACVVKSTITTSASANAGAVVQTPAKPLWQEAKRQPLGGDRDKKDDDDDSSSAESDFEGKAGDDNDDEDEYKISFSQETLGRRASSQRKSRKTVRYSEAASSEDGDDDDDDDDDNIDEESGRAGKKKEHVTNKRTSSSSSRRSVSKKSASFRVISHGSGGEESTAEDTSDGNDDDEAYVDPHIGASRSRSANGRPNSTRKRKSPPKSKDSSRTTTKTRKKVMEDDEIVDDSSVEIVEVNDDDDSDEAYVDQDAVASRSSSSSHQGSSRKRKTLLEEKGVNGKARATKNQKMLKKGTDTGHDSEVEVVEQIVTKPNRNKAAPESRKGAAVNLVGSEDTGMKGKGKNLSSSAASERKLSISKASQSTKKPAVTGIGSAALDTASGEKLPTSANGKAGEKPKNAQPVEESTKTNGKRPAQTKVSSGPKAEPARRVTNGGTAVAKLESQTQISASKASQKSDISATSRTDGKRQSSVKGKQPLVTEPESQSTPERRRRRKPSTPSRTSPAKRKLDLSDNEFSFLG